MRTLSFHPEARQDLQDSAEFYNRESEKVRDDFLAEVQRLIESIEQIPIAGSPLEGGARRRLCDRFPYGIVYRVFAAEIRILAIMHLHRRPDYWIGRH